MKFTVHQHVSGLMDPEETFTKQRYLKWVALAVVLVVAGSIYLASGTSEIPLVTYLIHGFSNVDAGVLHGTPVRVAGGIMVAGGCVIMRSSWLRYKNHEDHQ